MRSAASGSSTAIMDSLTRWRTPASAAAAATRSSSGSVGLLVTRKTEVTPRSARSRACRSAYAPATTSALFPTAPRRSGRRARIRTGPAAASCAATSRPTAPVAPVTRITCVPPSQPWTRGPVRTAVKTSSPFWRPDTRAVTVPSAGPGRTTAPIRHGLSNSA